MEITGSRFVDPLTLKPVRLSPGAIAALAGELKPNKASPLSAFASLKAAPNTADLDALGITHAARPTGGSGKGKLYRQALETLAAPEATLTMAEVGGGQPPLSVRIVLGAERAVMADVDSDGLSLSPPVSYPELVKALARHFENTPMYAEQRAFWPSQLKLLTALFSNEAGALELEVGAAGVKVCFDRSGVAEAEGKQVLEELVKHQLIEAKAGGAYALGENAAFWLTRLATGQIGELTWVLYDEAGNAQPQSTELRFVGAPKDRVTMVTVRGEELKGLVGGEAPESAGVVCQVMDRGALSGFLEAYLGLAQE
ncbi:MAG: hypothetical protein JNK82_31905 [Myxococcaceae bacterium]|nr:hypothetical protein [Myxococcaceae bacterium]